MQGLESFFVFVGIVFLLIFASACKEDLCKDINCLNGGTCMEGSCQCPDGFEGALCEQSQEQKFFGTYQASYDCFSVLHSTKIEAHPDSADWVRIINLGDYACPADNEETVIVDARVSGDSLFIDSQTRCQGNGFSGYTISGTGLFAGNILTLSFTSQYDAGGLPITDVCVASLQR